MKQQSVPDLIVTAIIHGIKILVLKWLSISAGISVLLAIAALRTFKRLTYPNVQAIAAKLHAKKGCEDIASILSFCASFPDHCQELYDKGPKGRTPQDFHERTPIEHACVSSNSMLHTPTDRMNVMDSHHLNHQSSLHTRTSPLGPIETAMQPIL